MNAIGMRLKGKFSKNLANSFLSLKLYVFYGGRKIL